MYANCQGISIPVLNALCSILTNKQTKKYNCTYLCYLQAKTLKSV